MCTMHVHVGAENEIRYVQAWDALAEIIVADNDDGSLSYTSGVSVMVTGRATVQEWTTADGKTHSRNIINATKVELG